MSSHHIVREKQEPALLVFQPEGFSFEYLGQLLEWSPTVIATQEWVETLSANQIKIDWLLTNRDYNTTQSDIKIMRVEDEDYTSAALEHLIDLNYPAVNIIDTFATNRLNRYLAFVTRINLVIYTLTQKIYAVETGFKKWKPAGEELTLYSPVAGLQTTGLKQTAVDTYQTTTDGFFQLMFKQPNLLIGEMF